MFNFGFWTRLIIGQHLAPQFQICWLPLIQRPGVSSPFDTYRDPNKVQYSNNGPVFKTRNILSRRISCNFPLIQQQHLPQKPPKATGKNNTAVNRHSGQTTKTRNSVGVTNQTSSWDKQTGHKTLYIGIVFPWLKRFLWTYYLSCKCR